LLKMALFLGIVALEVWPMMTLMRWRRNSDIRSSGNAGRIEVISYVQCALVIAVVLAASGTARGYGSTGPAPAVPVNGSAQHADSMPASGDTGPVSPAGAASDSLRGAALPLPPVPAIEPTGVETVTEADLALLASEIAMP